MVNVGDAARDRVFDRDHAEFGLAGVDRGECIFEGRARHRFVVGIDVARGEVGVRSRLALEYDLLGCRHGRSGTHAAAPSQRLAAPHPEEGPRARFRAFSTSTGPVSKGEARHPHPSRRGPNGPLLSMRMTAMAYEPCLPPPRISRARSRSAGVSTPSGTLSTMVASMRMPA